MRGTLTVAADQAVSTSARCSTASGWSAGRAASACGYSPGRVGRTRMMPLAVSPFAATAVLSASSSTATTASSPASSVAASIQRSTEVVAAPIKEHRKRSSKKKGSAKPKGLSAKQPPAASSVPSLDLSSVGRTDPASADQVRSATSDDGQATSSAVTAVTSDTDTSAPSSATSATASDDDPGDHGQALAALAVVERLLEDLEDLESHQRLLNMDLKPSKLLDELATIDRHLPQLHSRSAKLKDKVALLDDRAELLERYDRVLASYADVRKMFKHSFAKDDLRAEKHEIEKRFAVTVRFSRRRPAWLRGSPTSSTGRRGSPR